MASAVLVLELDIPEGEFYAFDKVMAAIKNCEPPFVTKIHLGIKEIADQVLDVFGVASTTRDEEEDVD